MMLATFSETVGEWVHTDDGGELATAIEHGFALMAELCAGWFAGTARQR
jgi:hypothetical protein